MSLKKILGSVAPFLGTMVGGPFGAAAGKLVSNVLLGKDIATNEELERAISSASPEQLVELKKVDADYKIKMAELGIDEHKLAVMDRESARQREIKTGDKTPNLLAFLLTFGFFGVLSLIIFYPMQESAKSIVDIMLGSLGTAWISVITYYFGSSYGSKIKTDIMNK